MKSKMNLQSWVTWSTGPPTIPGFTAPGANLEEAGMIRCQPHPIRQGKYPLPWFTPMVDGQRRREYVGSADCVAIALAAD